MAKEMRRLIIKSFLKTVMFFLVIGFCLTNKNLFAQEVSSSDYVPSDIYEKVLDKVFPRNDSKEFTDGREFAMTLRYVSEESQINIVKLNDGDFEITTYELPKSSLSIYEQLKKILEKDKNLDTDLLASQIKITTQNIRPTPSINKIIGRFSTLRLSPQLESGIILDGKIYDFEYKTFTNEVSFKLQSSKPKFDPTEFPLIKWMNEVKNSVFKKQTLK